MKGIVPLFLGIFGTFAFSWAGLVLIPNFQIGHLDPQMDEEGTDVYPAPKSGMADRGRRIYAANGCTYCHSQQVRADYASSDLERTRDLDRKQNWAQRRSAPRDYLFERPVLLGKMRMGPDLSNIGKSAPSEDETAAPPASTNPSATPAPQTAPGGSPAPASTAPPVTSSASSPKASPSNSPSSAASAAPSAAPAPPATASPSASSAKVVSANTPAAPSTNAAATTASVSPAPVNPAANAAAEKTSPKDGPPQYSAAWHHRHLYSPRSVTLDSNMPAYHFLYEKRRVSGERAADALNLSGNDATPEGWEIVPTYDAKCLVAYLMSLDQSHVLKEVKATAAPPPSAPPPSPAAASASPVPTKEAK